MLLGHYAVGFAVKKASPKLSLGTVFFAAQFIDMLWPVFLLLGIERVSVVPGNTVVTPLNFDFYPFSHSLAAVLFWAALFGSIYWVIRRDTAGALWLGAAVTSHWFLDLIVHRPDLPLFPGSSFFAGFSVWNSTIATVIIEYGLLSIGVFLYLKATRPKDKTGTYSLVTLIVLLALIYLANLLGPPPPDNGKIIAVPTLLLWLFVPWGYWIERHRSLRK